MWCAASRHAALPNALAWRVLATTMLAVVLSGCAADGQPGATLIAARGRTIAFESIDGPPQPVFQKLVENLAAEAVARQVTVISREATPQYRIRGYLAASVEGRRTHIGWVWDVYDGQKQRMLRIVGEEPGVRRASDAWSVADDQMLRQIARTSIDRLAAFLAGSGGSPSPAAEPAAEQTVAAADPSVFAPAVAAAVALADTRN